MALPSAGASHCSSPVVRLRSMIMPLVSGWAAGLPLNVTLPSVQPVGKRCSSQTNPQAFVRVSCSRGSAAIGWEATAIQRTARITATVRRRTNGRLGLAHTPVLLCRRRFFLGLLSAPGIVGIDRLQLLQMRHRPGAGIIVEKHDHHVALGERRPSSGSPGPFGSPDLRS